LCPKVGFLPEDRSESTRLVDVLDMKKNPFIRVLLMSILAGLVVASAGMASAGRLAFIGMSAEKSTVRHESTTCAPDDEGTSEDEGTSDDQGVSDDQGTSQDESSSKECEEPDEGDGTTDAGEGDETTKPTDPADPADREAECKTAAGQSTVAEGEGGSDGTLAGGTQTEVKKGLDHAIEVVLANCIKNPQSQGLVNALRHLVANRDRHLAHQAEKDARRAAREAAKAARRAAHTNGHGKGSD
jgi:hypothetical protein